MTDPLKPAPPPAPRGLPRPRALGSFLLEVYQAWREDNAQTLGAALAFYTTFSLAPLLIVVIAVFGLVVGRETIQLEILSRLQELISVRGALALKQLIKALYPPESNPLATGVAVILILFAATTAFVMLTNALNKIWNVKPLTESSPEAGIWNFFKTRLLAFLMILVLGLILVLSLIFSTVLAALGYLVQPLISLPIYLFRLADFIFSMCLVTLLFALIYRVLPGIKIAWGHVWLGAAITAVLFVLGKFLLGLYFAHSRTVSAYGAAGALAVVLLWIYYCAQTVFLGAEITKVYARRHQSPGNPPGPSDP